MVGNGEADGSRQVGCLQRSLIICIFKRLIEYNCQCIQFVNSMSSPGFTDIFHCEDTQQSKGLFSYTDDGLNDSLDG